MDFSAWDNTRNFQIQAVVNGVVVGGIFTYQERKQRTVGAFIRELQRREICKIQGKTYETEIFRSMFQDHPNERCVTIPKDKSGYKDITGTLKDSAKYEYVTFTSRVNGNRDIKAGDLLEWTEKSRSAYIGHFTRLKNQSLILLH